MTDIWDTLWEFWDAGKVDPFFLTTCFPDFIKKIRVEGNRLKYYSDWVKRLENFESINFHQRSMALGMSVAEFRQLKEKAEKWDNIESQIEAFAGNKLEWDNAKHQLLKKLEAIKNQIINAQNSFTWKNFHPDADDELKIKFRGWLEGWLKILEGE